MKRWGLPGKTVAARVMRSTNTEDMQVFVCYHFDAGAMLYTDEAVACKRMPEYDHQAVDLAVFEYVRDMAHTDGIESFWVLLKRGYHGTFHRISEKHLHRYVAEFATRHNMRPQDTIDMVGDTMARMVGKRLTCNETHCRLTGETATWHKASFYQRQTPIQDRPPKACSRRARWRARCFRRLLKRGTMRGAATRSSRPG